MEHPPPPGVEELAHITERYGPELYGPEQARRCAVGDCTHTHMVDLRCPVPARDPDAMGKLLGRTQASALPDGVIELACGNCARAHRAAGVACSRVLHRFNLLGELLATEIVV